MWGGSLGKDHGFARILCPDCSREYLLAFSCKTRYFCAFRSFLLSGNFGHTSLGSRKSVSGLQA